MKIIIYVNISWKNYKKIHALNCQRLFPHFNTFVFRAIYVNVITVSYNFAKWSKY